MKIKFAAVVAVLALFATSAAWAGTLTFHVANSGCQGSLGTSQMVLTTSKASLTGCTSASAASLSVKQDDALTHGTGALISAPWTSIDHFLNATSASYNKLSGEHLMAVRATPEPSSVILFATMLAAFGLMYYRFRASQSDC